MVWVADSLTLLFIGVFVVLTVLNMATGFSRGPHPCCVLKWSIVFKRRPALEPSEAPCALALSLYVAAICAGSPLVYLASSKRWLQFVLKNRARTVVLFLDSIVVNEIPARRAVWAPIGKQACVPVIAAHAVRVLTRISNIRVAIAWSAPVKYRASGVSPAVRERGCRIVSHRGRLRCLS
jgi:hypothetical protein